MKENMMLSFYHEIRSLVHFIPQTVMISSLSIMAYIFIEDNKGNIKKRFIEFFTNGWTASFVIYFSFLLTVTLIGRYRTNPYQNIVGNFGLFTSGKSNPEVIANIVLYLPYTFLYIKAFNPKHMMVASIALATCTSVIIEILQLIFWLGQFSFADIIHNIIGGILGYILMLFLDRLRG